MHRLHRVRFFIVTHDGDDYGERLMLAEVTPAKLEACRLDMEDAVRYFGGLVFPPEVLWHSHFRRRKGRLCRPHHRPRRQKDRAHRRRELMLRDKQRILDRCSTTERD